MANANRDGETGSGWIPSSEGGATVLWTVSNGVRCVVTRYDERRYQLRLLRESGTIKADLFSNHAEALANSREWRQQMENAGPLDTDFD